MTTQPALHNYSSLHNTNTNTNASTPQYHPRLKMTFVKKIAVTVFATANGEEGPDCTAELAACMADADGRRLPGDHDECLQF